MRRIVAFLHCPWKSEEKQRGFVSCCAMNEQLLDSPLPDYLRNGAGRAVDVTVSETLNTAQCPMESCEIQPAISLASGCSVALALACPVLALGNLQKMTLRPCRVFKISSAELAHCRCVRPTRSICSATGPALEKLTRDYLCASRSVMGVSGLPRV